METKLSGRLAIVEQDDWLKPVEGAMTERYAHFCRRLSDIERTAGSLVDYANGYLYFGFQYDPVRRGWWFREWLPGAIDVYLFGDLRLAAYGTAVAKGCRRCVVDFSAR